MNRPGPRNLITDVTGLKVGQAADIAARTGVTVIVPDRPALAAVDVRGGAPGTRETETLAPDNLVDRVDAICLAGGSVWGLEAASGVAAELAQAGRGLEIGLIRVPIVPAAILFDLANGGDKDWGLEPPYRRLGSAAFRAAGPEFRLGSAGAGFGASAGRLQGGIGSASTVTEDGIEVGALVAANPVGSVVMADGRTFWAWALEHDGEAGGHSAPEPGQAVELDLPAAARLGANTTLGLVATNVALTKAQARRVAIMAHDGIARAIRPAHTPFDGDIIFTLSTGHRPLAEPAPLALSRIGSIAADCIARAVMRAVHEAEDIGHLPAYRERWRAPRR